MPKAKQKKAQSRAAKPGKRRNALEPAAFLKRFIRWEALLILAAIICDGNSWGHQFVLDDTSYLVENHFIQNPENAFRIFISPLVPNPVGIGHSYRPLTAFSLGANYWIHGLNPDGFHVANRLFHLIVCLGIFWVLRELLPHSAAFLAALLFAVHPIQTEAVTYIQGRSDALAMLFFVFALLFHIRARRSDPTGKGYVAAALVFYLFAMMSKESGITWIAVALIVEYVYFSKRNPASLWQSLKGGLWKVFAGYLTAALVFLALQSFALSRVRTPETFFVDNPLAHASFLVRALTALKVLFQSLGLLLWPFNLSADYSYNQIPVISSWSSLPGLCVIAAGLAFLVVLGWSHYRAPNVFFGMSYFIATYSVVSNLILPIGTIRADRLLYMPSLGILLIAGVFLSGLDRRIQGRIANKLFRALIAVAVVLLMVQTVRRNGDWRDPATLAAKTVQSAPGSSRAHTALGTRYYTERKYDLALRQYRRAESIYSEDPTLLHNIGITLSQLGNSEEAIRYFTRAVELAPLHVTIRFNLAYALRARGDLAGAQSQYDAIIALFDDLIRKDPSVADYHFNKANALVIQEQYERALVEYKRTVEIDPKHGPARRAIFDLENRRSGSAPPAPRTDGR